MSDDQQGAIRIADVVTGVFLGALAGILVGLTTASVTTTVLSSVLAIATTFIGLSGDAKVIGVTVNHARVAGFAAAMTCTLLAGLWIRTHDALSPNLKDLKDQLVAAGIGDARAQDLIIFAKFGLLPKDANVVASDTGAAQPSIRSVLFADAPQWCDDFRRRQSQPVDVQITWLGEQGGTYSALAARIKNLPDDRRGEIVRSGLFYICGFDS